MTLRLDPVMVCNGLRVAALCRVDVTGLSLGGGMIFHGAKKPVALLVAQGDTRRAFGPDGIELAADLVEGWHPGAWAAVLGG